QVDVLEVVLARAADADRRLDRAGGAVRWNFRLIQLLIPVAWSAVTDAAARARAARRAAAANRAAARCGRGGLRLAAGIAGVLARFAFPPRCGGRGGGAEGGCGAPGASPWPDVPATKQDEGRQQQEKDAHG